MTASRSTAATRAIDQLRADLELLASKAEQVRPGYALCLNAEQQLALARALGAAAYLVELQLAHEDAEAARPWTALVERLSALEKRAA